MHEGLAYRHSYAIKPVPKPVLSSSQTIRPIHTSTLKKYGTAAEQDLIVTGFVTSGTGRSLS